MKIIPIIHCFDQNYVLPAAVCFQSLLEHADTANARYALHVVGDIPESDQTLLRSIVGKFENASVDFIPPPPLPVDATVIPQKGHYSPDLYNKLAIPELFLQYEKVIVADVDVVYQDDIAKAFDAFPIDGKHLVAGVWDLGYAAYHRKGLFPTGRPLIRKYARVYTSEELDRLRIGAGLLVFDMKGLRDGGWTAEWKAFAKKNAYRAILPEQEVLNLTLGDAVKILPLNYMAIAEHAPLYDNMVAAVKNENSSWDEMYAHPVQMHYASKIKPWKYPGSARSELWFDACVRAGMIESWRRWYAAFSAPMVSYSMEKTLADCKMGRFHIRLTKERSTR